MKALGLILTLALVGCGGAGAPTSLQTCKDACSFQKSCAGATSADVKACQVQCDADKATFDGDDAQINDCQNAADIHHGIHDCYTQDCDQTEAMDCAQPFIDSCVQK